MKNMSKMALFLAGVVCSAWPGMATDQAVLRNGFAIEHERRVLVEDGRVTRLFLTNEGSSFVDVATEEISGFDKLERAPELASVSKENFGKASSVVLSKPDIGVIVGEASDRHQIDADLIRSVIRAESRFKPNAVSKKGARGLMQLMPATAESLGVMDSFDARENVMGGTRYLRELLARFDYDMVKALAAYNAGSTRVERYKGVPPYRETRAYVAEIVREFNRSKMAERKVAALRAMAEPSAPAADTLKKKNKPATFAHE